MASYNLCSIILFVSVLYGTLQNVNANDKILMDNGNSFFITLVSIVYTIQRFEERRTLEKTRIRIQLPRKARSRCDLHIDNLDPHMLIFYDNFVKKKIGKKVRF